jgi:hypothetical protein
MKAFQLSTQGRSLIDAFGRLFDVFGLCVPPEKPLTPEDDARNLQADRQRINEDFARVLSRLEAAAPNK